MWNYLLPHFWDMILFLKMAVKTEHWTEHLFRLPMHCSVIVGRVPLQSNVVRCPSGYEGQKKATQPGGGGGGRGGRPCLVGVQYSAAPGHQAQLSCFLFSVCRPIRIGNQGGKGKQEAQGKAAAAAKSLLAENQQKWAVGKAELLVWTLLSWWAAAEAAAATFATQLIARTLVLWSILISSIDHQSRWNI